MDKDAHHYATINGIVPVKLTQRIVQQQPNWNLWEQSEFKEYNSYETQEMFGPPMPLR